MKASHKFSIKTRSQLEDEKRQLQVLQKIPNSFKPSKSVNREMRKLRNNLAGADSYSLVAAEDLKMVRKTDPSVNYDSKRAVRLNRLYEPPIKNSFLVNS